MPVAFLNFKNWETYIEIDFWNYDGIKANKFTGNDAAEYLSVKFSRVGFNLNWNEIP